MQENAEKKALEDVKQQQSKDDGDKQESEKENKEGLLVPLEKYLQHGVHIGTKIKTGDMKRFIFKRRKDRIYVLDINAINERLTYAFNLLKRYEPKDILVVATRTYAGNAAKKMQSYIGEIDVITRRFIPGTLTNPELEYFKEPRIILVCDPRGESEAIREANIMNIPVVALVDTDNKTQGIDLIVPINNKGRKSLALFFWLLTRELLVGWNRIKDYSEFKVPVSTFEKLEIEE